MAQNVCRILLKQEDLKSEAVSLASLPVGDLFRTTSLTPEDYELFSNPLALITLDIDTKNTFYSSEYMKLLGEAIHKER